MLQRPSVASVTSSGRRQPTSYARLVNRPLMLPAKAGRHAKDGRPGCLGSVPTSDQGPERRAGGASACASGRPGGLVGPPSSVVLAGPSCYSGVPRVTAPRIGSRRSR
jgi:hypothetical protein